MNDPLTDDHADHIARLLAEGRTLAQVTMIARCTRARVLHVADLYGWRLDANGVLPRPARPAVTPGRPVPARAAGMGTSAPRGHTNAPLPQLPPLPPPRQPMAKQKCRTPGCDRHARTGGLCQRDYMRARRAAS